MIDLNNWLGITESYLMPEKLMNVLLNADKRVELFDMFTKNATSLESDILRDYFQEQHSNRNGLKQDYTPDSLCELVSRLSGKVEQVIDVCSGTGSLTIGVLKNNKDIVIQCEEYSGRSIPVLLLNLAIRNVNAVVIQKNVLTEEITNTYKLEKGEKYSNIEETKEQMLTKSKLVISNPPYSMKWEPKYDKRFEGYELAPSSKADYSFILDNLYRTTDKALIILPTGVLFRGNAEGKIRKQLLINNYIDAVIGLPDKMFLNTQIPVIILILNKNKSDNEVLFIDASKGFKVDGKQNVLEEKHIDKIVDTYVNRKSENYYSKVVRLEELASNDYNMNIPRYIDQYAEKKDTSNTKELIDNLIKLDKEYAESISVIGGMLQEMQGTNEQAERQFAIVRERAKMFNIFQTEQSWSELSNALEKLDNEISKMKKQTIRLDKLSTIERAIKGKVYKKGSSYLQISATKGQFEYLNDDSELEPKYAVIIPNPDINSKYLFYSIQSQLEEYLAKVQQEININIEDIYKMPIIWHSNEVDQQLVLDLLNLFDNQIENAEKAIENEKEFKSNMLNDMFPESRKEEKTLDIKEEENQTTIFDCLND